MKNDFSVIEEVRRIRQIIDNRINDVRLSVHETLVMQGNATPFINQRKAYRLYGKQNIENWEKWGLIKRIKDKEGNGQVRYELSRLILLSQTSNRCEYFKTKNS